MPLAERDANTQHRRSLARGQSSPASGRENTAPSPTVNLAKDAPRHSQRFLAPTKASAAKLSTPPSTERSRLQPHSNRSVPPSQSPASRLPRPGLATPTPPVGKWSVAFNQSTVWAENSASDSSPSLSPSKGENVTGEHSLITFDATREATHQTRAEKPLPSRPIASLVSAPSPSRDSRSLIDASERPLRLSIAGSEREWPTLVPTTHSSPTITSTPTRSPMSETILPSGRLSASAASMVSSAAQLTAIASPKRASNDSTPSETPTRKRSSTPSYISASEVSQAPDNAMTAGPPTCERDFGVKSPDGIISEYPPRTSSLPQHVDDGSNIGRLHNENAITSHQPDFPQDKIGDSRPHSPSPASFSRPRPTSVSHGYSMMSVPAAVAITPVKSQKTASRIPLPDQKKATLVDIKARRSSGIPEPVSRKGLSFGGRRIDSPDPLKVLDHGIKRRQLRRETTNGSTSTTSTVPTKFLSDSTYAIDGSKATTPDSTLGSTSEDEEEIATPSDQPLHYIKHDYKTKHVPKAPGGQYGGEALKVSDESEVILGRPPPSNSPFTGPLQTIPSQTLLPLQSSPDRRSVQDESHPKIVIKPTEFSAFAQRLFVIEDLNGLGNNGRGGHRSIIDDDTKYELLDLLREAKREDALISQCGSAGLDDETKEEITRTLSILEGNHGPIETAADLEHLSRLLWRLKSGFEKAPKSAAFVEDAAVAERFLARQEGIATKATQQDLHLRDASQPQAPLAARKDDDVNSQLSKSKTVRSKWSDSTASMRDIPFPPGEVGSTGKLFGMDPESFPPIPLPKDLQTGIHRSIGYPSRTPGKAHRLLGTNENDNKVRTSNAKRESSPTLGARLPGSVRAAREKVTTSSGSRPNAVMHEKPQKMPTSNTRAFNVSEDSTRGRSHPFGNSSRISLNKIPRSHSKGRYVLDKINGLFSGRRDRRNSGIPPVPPVKDSFDSAKPRSTFKEPYNTLHKPEASPKVKSSRVPPLTKMPTISPPVESVHPALRSAPSLTSVAPSAMTTSSHTDYDGRRSLQALSEKLLGRAQMESDPARKERMLNFAKVLNDSLISAREAQISAETAQTAARSAQLSYEMTMKSVAMLQRLAAGMNRR